MSRVSAGETAMPTSFESEFFLSVVDVDKDGLAMIFKAEKGPVSRETMSNFRMSPLENPYQMTPHGRAIRDIAAYRKAVERLLPQVSQGSWKQFLEGKEDAELSKHQDLKSLEDFVLPERRVRPGDEWRCLVTVTNERGRFQITQTYKLEEVKRDLAYISMRQTEALIPGSGTEFGATMRVSQELNRNAIFNIGQGLLIEIQEEKNAIIEIGADGNKSITRMGNRRKESLQ